VKSEFPDHFTRKEKEVFQQKVAPYSLIKGILFKLGGDEQLRRCLEGLDRKKVIESLHSGNSGGHFASVNTVNRIRTAGYWWPYMNRDVKSFVDSCDQCQRTGAPSFRNHWPLTPIIPLAPFEKWGIDFIGPISPVSSQRKRYIILATDYATKWVEGMRLAHEPGAGSGEQGKRERGAGIVVRNPEIDKFHQKLNFFPDVSI
jgi:hypothetical protein